MKNECIQFWSTQYADAAARESLPPELRNELIEGAWGIQVDATKTQVIEDLEKRLQIGMTDDFVKYVYVEVDKREISNYSHFYIRPQLFDWMEDALFEITPRTYDKCSCGVSISSPIQIRSSALQGIGMIDGVPMLDTRLLLVTPEVRELFEAEGISGLEYASFEDIDGASAPGYIAKVTHCAHEVGTKIVAKPCEHHSIAGALVFDSTVPKDDLCNDFQMIDRVTVKGTDYTYWVPLLVVSQNALSLLLENEVAGMESITVMLDEVFRPVIVS